MDVKNCKSCGRLFNYIGGQRLCQACRDALNHKFDEVKKYIEENPHATMQQVSDDMEVSVAQLTQWVREERLVFSADSMVTIDCELCGTAIRTGRFCDRCKNEMVRNLGSAYASSTPSPLKARDLRDRDKMRFLDK